MTEQVVVLGSGYAGAGAVRSLEDELDGEADIRWISDTDYHLVLHESHRCISDPNVADKITIPVEDIKSPRTEFVQGRAEDIDVEDRTVHLEDGSEHDYDYLLVAVGSQTAFFGIDGLEEHAHTLKSLDDALAIHEDIKETAHEATKSDPAQIVIGGAGLSGIQTAGEVAEFRDEHNAPLDIHLVEGLDEIFPGNDESIQQALRTRLEARDVNILTGDFISEVDEERAYLGEDDELDYDVLVWTGGITGQDTVSDTDVEKDDRNHRLNTGMTFQTSDERVFALGDCALIEQHDDPAPPTAQAAWQAAEVVGENIARTIHNRPLKEWTYDDKGTVVSVGESAVAHDVSLFPFLDTFGGFPAKTLKKAIAARWIASVTGVGTAMKAWPDM
ncbi:NADH dehydrogenase [Halovenus aranensis]|uniref:NADH dehydrogenase n=1 Tax=Halovenus aranensis TaxID=890420 RepID=A0A1G8XSS6_9EURY|nr:NAD(P)/FAD-dependent oxidoreductase [Halovenus aranensis]SDJ93496.1 NADH dehydrogenase [Halovenus aranensis]